MASNVGLVANALSCTRGERQLFAGLNFALQAGQILLVEGANGSGKSSLLRMLCGLRPPDDGQLLWCGTDIASLGTAFYQDVAYIGHSNGIKGHLSVTENLHHAQALARPGLDIDDSIQKLGLWACRNLLAQRLSAGQKRRLALARLLCTQKRLWVLDEPFTALDSEHVGLCTQLVAAHAAQGGLAVVASHHEADFAPTMTQTLRLPL